MAVRTYETQTPTEALIVEHALMLARELERTADAAPDGQVLAQAEAIILGAGREFLRTALTATVEAQGPALEKKGPRRISPPGPRSTCFQAEETPVCTRRCGGAQ